MITPNDFKNAIGKPDKNFENSVQQALDEIRFSERRIKSNKLRPLQFVIPAAALVAVAACALLMFGITGGQPDKVAQQGGVLAQPSDRPTVTAEPTLTAEEAPTTATESTSISEEAPAESEIQEQPAAPVQPTPPPVSTNLPEDHWMLTDTLGIDINSLYPNFTYTGTVTNKSADKYWMVSNGQDDLIACCVSYGDIMNSDIKNGSFACPTLTIYMPIDAKSDKRIHMMMAASAPWLSELYENSRSMFVESYPDIKLNSLEIAFDESNTPKFCEMYFGDNCEFYISFMREENSDTFTIIKVYTQPEYEFLDYDDPAEYNTMEVAFEDPALEDAIRAALNWEGKLTPAKLAELEKLELSGLSISSLSGIEYCTNLTHLDLYGCGIGNENMKYVASLPSLTTLILHGNDITDITNLSDLELTFLQLSDNRISNLWPLSGMTSLRVLMLDDNQLSGEGSLKPLESLSNLEKLYLQRCGITDVYPIAELADHGCLKTLDLSENPIEDLSPIEGLELPELFYNK